MATPAACDPALVGKSKVDSGASAVVKASADLLTREGVSDMSTRLGGGGTTGSIWSGGGCTTWGDGFRLGMKGMVGSTPNQDILFYLVPWDEASFVPGDSLSKQTVIFDAHTHGIRAKQLAHDSLILYHL